MGSLASDSRVLRDALSRPTGLKVLTRMDARGCTQVNEQEKRGNRRVWLKEEEKALLGIMDEIIHHKQAEGWRDKPFPLYERLANIFGKDRATGRTAYTPESLAANLEEDDNFGNEFEMPARNFSPMSVNQTDFNQQMNQASSQPVSRKRSRSGDPIVRSIDRFTNVMNDAIDKTTDTLDKMCQVLAKSKMNENRVIADDLQKMRLPLS
ncbi:hypothetical protein LWI29_023772 [Acer saccharum]|uniref:Myb/SANT-like domain-containing protein n=1 Tax=Acer saccharum TaxID=4024 RepID=A0AA39RGA8_ACESA|nr:hypothetical protein LWI29_023772 [Acer saccharum]